MKITKDISTKFAKLNISSWCELALIIPNSYEDFRLKDKMQIHKPQLLDATVESVLKTQNSIQITFYVHNFAHTITGVVFKPKPYMLHQFKVGNRDYYYGVIECNGGYCSIAMPKKLQKLVL